MDSHWIKPVCSSRPRGPIHQHSKERASSGGGRSSVPRSCIQTAWVEHWYVQTVLLFAAAHMWALDNYAQAKSFAHVYIVTLMFQKEKHRKNDTIVLYGCKHFLFDGTRHPLYKSYPRSYYVILPKKLRRDPEGLHFIPINYYIWLNRWLTIHPYKVPLTIDTCVVIVRDMYIIITVDVCIPSIHYILLTYKSS